MRHSSCKRSASVTKRRRALSRCRSQQCHLLFPPARRGRAGTGAPGRPGQCPPATPSPPSRASGAEGSPGTAPTAPPGPAAQQLPSSPAPAAGGLMPRQGAGRLAAPRAAAAGRGAPSTRAPGVRGGLRCGARGKAEPCSCVQKPWRWPDLQYHRRLAEQILRALHKYLKTRPAGSFGISNSAVQNELVMATQQMDVYP